MSEPYQRPDTTGWASLTVRAAFANALCERLRLLAEGGGVIVGVPQPCPYCDGEVVLWGWQESFPPYYAGRVMEFRHSQPACSEWSGVGG